MTADAMTRPELEAKARAWLQSGVPVNENTLAALLAEVEAAALRSADTDVLVLELNGRMVACPRGHAPELLALWPCHRCARTDLEAQVAALRRILTLEDIANSPGFQMERMCALEDTQAAAAAYTERVRREALADAMRVTETEIGVSMPARRIAAAIRALAAPKEADDGE